MKKIRSANGITMISLVITIIVMLILSGVVLNSVMGDRSVIKQASDARDKQEEAAAIEEMNLKLASLNTELLTGNSDKDEEDIEKIFQGTATSEEDFQKGLGDLWNKEFKRCLYFGDYYIIEYNDHFFEVREDATNKGQYVVSKYLNSDLTLASDNYIITEKNADDVGRLTFEAGKSYTVLDEISAEEFNFIIPAAVDNKGVNLYLTEDMTIDNLLTAEEKASGKTGRSAIELEPNAILNLYISAGATITVNSTYGADGTEANNVLGVDGGPGGFAGIHVPKTATLHVYGDGTLIAYGGDAGDGGGAVSGNTGGGGGGGAGAGIGGNGGQGGNAGSTFTRGAGSNDLNTIRALGQTLENSGKDGGAGEDCGNIYFHGTTVVYAYGGAGGSGGSKNTTNNSGAGGGGYPAAGIGGGGAGGGGGDHACPAGGYSAGSGEGSVAAGYNGQASGMTSVNWMITAGGYYQKGLAARPSQVTTRAYFNQGGMWSSVNGEACFFMDHSGSGGEAGAGGNVYYTDASKIFAYNGDMITNGNYNEAFDYSKDGERGNLITKKVQKEGSTETIIPAKIFAQTGIIRATYKTNQHMSDEEAIANGTTPCTGVNGVRSVEMTEETKTNVTNYKNGFAENQGIGSGAGNLEKSNGTFVKITE